MIRRGVFYTSGIRKRKKARHHIGLYALVGGSGGTRTLDIPGMSRLL